MGEQVELWVNPTVGAEGAHGKVGDPHDGPALVVEDQGGTVRLHVEGAPAPKYGPGKGRKARRT